MNETRTRERISAARRRSHTRRHADSGLVASYIHQLSERHGEPRSAPTRAGQAARAILIALNTALALGWGLDFELVDLQLTVLDLIGLGIAGVMIALLLGRAVRNLRELSRREPGARRR